MAVDTGQRGCPSLVAQVLSGPNGPHHRPKVAAGPAAAAPAVPSLRGPSRQELPPVTCSCLARRTLSRATKTSPGGRTRGPGAEPDPRLPAGPPVKGTYAVPGGHLLHRSRPRSSPRPPAPDRRREAPPPTPTRNSPAPWIMKIARLADPAPTIPTGVGGGGGGAGGGSTGLGAAPQGARASQVGSSRANSGTRMATGCQGRSAVTTGFTLPGEGPTSILATAPSARAPASNQA